MTIAKKRVSAALLVLLMFASVLLGAIPARADDVLYESAAEQMNEVIPNVITGSRYTVELTLNITSIQPSPDANIRGVKFVLGQLSKGVDVELWFGYNMVQINDSKWSSGVFQRVDHSLKDLQGKDTKVKLVVSGASFKLYMNDAEICSFTEPSLTPAANSKFYMNQWDTPYVVKEMKISGTADTGGDSGNQGGTVTPAPNPGGTPDLGEVGSNTAAGDDWYYNDFNGGAYNGMNAAEGVESVSFKLDEAYAFNFQLEAVLNVKSIVKDSGRGVKFILRENPLASSEDLELWIGPEHIWVCASSWVGHTGFDFSTYMNRDVTVRIIVKDRSIRLYLDGFEVWSYEDPTFMVGSATQVELGGWDAKYQIKSIRLSPVKEESEEPANELKEEYEYPVPEMGGTKYYVDANASAGGDGKSPETAWNSIQQVNNHGVFLPDDQILFKRGCLWEGVTLQPQGYGVEGHPIIIDAYGEGELPVIDRKGEWVPGGLNSTSAVILKNQSYWTIRNIQVSNQNPVNPGTVEDVVVFSDHAEFPMRNGISIQANYIPGNKKNIVRGIVLENVIFANIDGTQGDEGNCYFYRVENKSAWSGGGALCVRAGDLDSGDCRAYIDGLKVEGCTFRNIGGVGVSTESGWTYYDSFKNVVVRNCRFYNEEDYKATFTGAYIVSAEAPLVEYNSMENMTNGIGFQVCSNAVAQCNTIVDMDGYLHTMSRFMGSAQYWDGCGIDADCRCKGTTIMRSNYIERCYAGSFGFFDYQDTLEAQIIIENNISFNSGRFIYYQCDNGSYSFKIRHNTVVRLADAPYTTDTKIVDIYNSTLGAGKMEVVGNIFYYPDQQVSLELTAGVYNRNAYIGILTCPQDAAAITADPMINLPASMDQTANISFNGSVAGTTSFCDSGLFTYKAGTPCYIGNELICGVDFAVLRGEIEETPEPSVVPTSPEITEPTGEDDTEPEKPSGPNGVVIAVIVVAIVAVLGVAAFFVLKHFGIIK